VQSDNLQITNDLFFGTRETVVEIKSTHCVYLITTPIKKYTFHSLTEGLYTQYRPIAGSTAEGVDKNGYLINRSPNQKMPQ